MYQGTTPIYRYHYHPKYGSNLLEQIRQNVYLASYITNRNLDFRISAHYLKYSTKYEVTHIKKCDFWLKN